MPLGEGHEIEDIGQHRTASGKEARQQDGLKNGNDGVYLLSRTHTSRYTHTRKI